jgi:hypothetical protein
VRVGESMVSRTLKWWKCASMMMLTGCVALLAGCASGGPTYTPLAAAPGSAVLYVYGGQHMFNAFANIAVKVDGQDSGSVGPEYYIAVQIKPGTHVVELQSDPIFGALFGNPKVSFSAAVGGSYFVRGTMMHYGGNAWGMVPSLVSSPQGRAEIVRMTRT